VISDPVELWLLRHGQSLGNVARDAARGRDVETLDIAERDMDVPLSPLGIQQATAFGRWLGTCTTPPEVVIASPYRRAMQTAELAVQSAGLDLRVHSDERLRERELGVLDLLTSRGVESRYPNEAERRRRLGKFYHRPPGGESWCDVILRLRSATEMISREYCGQRVLIVCHAVVVLCMRYILEHLTESELLAIDKKSDVANCAVTLYEHDESLGPRGNLRLKLFNFVAPLEEAGAPVTSEPDAKVGAR